VEKVHHRDEGVGEALENSSQIFIH
jgi:hypothetical protein